ncbi:MAG: 50S ribosomal protein L21 [Gammaproteobacteria bacterium]|jgi:large subunit ribosomal protein L21
MYAVIKTGGKQYRVIEGQKLVIEKLDHAIGQAFSLTPVLMLANGDQIKVGKPTVAGASVEAEVIKHGRGKKVHILKFRRRKHHMKQMGHRQSFTEIKITRISEG